MNALLPIARRFALIAVLIGFAPRMSAQSPEQPVMWYQGVLLDKESRPKPDGAYRFGFQVFKTEAANDPIAPRMDTTLPVINGTFGVGIPLSTFDDNKEGNYWLQVWVESEALSGRVRIGAVPYALRAKYAEGGNVFTASPLSTTNRSEGGVEIRLDMSFLTVAEGLKITRSDDGRTILIGLDSTRLRNIERDTAVEGDVLRFTAGGNWAPGPGPSDAPVGTVVAFAGDESSIPDKNRWLVCDGSSHTVSALPELYAVIGSKYNPSGTPAGTFRLPDYRGLFLRMVDKSSRGSRGIDRDGANRQVGSTQSDALAQHTHDYELAYYPGAGKSGGGAPDVFSARQTRATSPTGGTETRPINIGVLYLIKVKP